MINWFRILPHRCPICFAPANDYVCSGCETDLPRLEHACPDCALPVPLPQTCGDCLKNPKPFQRTLCAFRYEAPVDVLIQRLKRRDPHIISRYLAPWLLNRIDAQYTAQSLPELLVPVPVHWRDRLRRGFNQTEHLAHCLGRELQIPVACVAKKKHAAIPQKSLRRAARLANLKGSFNCSADLQGQHVAIIDDVITTGGTVTRMTECLLLAGAASVDIWALARTPKPG